MPLLLSPAQIALGQYSIQPITTPAHTKGIFLQNVSSLSLVMYSRIGSIQIPPAFVATLPMDENDQITFTAIPPANNNWPTGVPQYIDLSYSFESVAPSGTGLFITPMAPGGGAILAQLTGSNATNELANSYGGQFIGQVSTGVGEIDVVGTSTVGGFTAGSVSVPAGATYLSPYYSFEAIRQAMAVCEYAITGTSASGGVNLIVKADIYGAVNVLDVVATNTALSGTGTAKTAVSIGPFSRSSYAGIQNNLTVALTITALVIETN